eukprot:TRINITY_DN17061_c0_g1_i1.p1 TRINITY_DN17061_c0_g1~~TRINITY_DN17061_c0_g1_i1.p1  ORF type:complete len:430 (-),score=68.48 TRINITY_DN17061_c0_g1_i1:287-1576(-)
MHFFAGGRRHHGRRARNFVCWLCAAGLLPHIQHLSFAVGARSRLQRHLEATLSRRLPSATPELVHKLVLEVEESVRAGLANDDNKTLNARWLRRTDRLAWWLGENLTEAGKVLNAESNASAALEAADEYSSAAARNWQNMQLRHRSVRQKGEESVESLRLYAEAMQQVAGRPWHRAGIAWCRERCHQHFEGGGNERLEAKLKRRKHYEMTGERLEQVGMRSEQLQAPQLRLLDIGSCGNLFEQFPEFSVTALDLYPMHEKTWKCDFLNLEVGAEGSALVAAESGHRVSPQRCAGTLAALPARSFDVAVFSCVLSYIPRPQLRALAIEKAIALLSRPGLLLIIDTFTVDHRGCQLKSGSILREWREALAEAGLHLLQYQQLPSSHAMAWALPQSGIAKVGLKPLRVRLEADMDAARERRRMKRTMRNVPR